MVLIYHFTQINSTLLTCEYVIKVHLALEIKYFPSLKMTNMIFIYR
jgi:hypothetical protein